jgi:hypothetical protein
MKNHEPKKKVKKVKNNYFMGRSNYFLSTLIYNPWAILATWLHVGAPPEIQEK